MHGVTFASNLTNHKIQRYPSGNRSYSLQYVHKLVRDEELMMTAALTVEMYVLGKMIGIGVETGRV
jgi:hypothetical protein